jgi:hypothetical protein
MKRLHKIDKLKESKNIIIKPNNFYKINSIEFYLLDKNKNKNDYFIMLIRFNFSDITK